MRAARERREAFRMFFHETEEFLREAAELAPGLEWMLPHLDVIKKWHREP
jgi:hypothetical protein